MQVQAFPIELLCQAITAQSQGRLVCELIGPYQGVMVNNVAPLSKAQPHEVAFLANPKFIHEVKDCQAGVIVLRAGDKEKVYGDEAPRAMVIVEDPYAWFAYALQVVEKQTKKFIPGIHPRAIIAETAEVDPTARVDGGAVIEAHAKVGAGAWIGSNAVVGEGAVIGDGTHMFPNSTVNHGCIVGKRCILHSGSVIGADGFGFAPFKGEWVKIPQIGRAVLGDDVEIGGSTCVDRGALEDTVVGRGSKIDNLVQIAHNCKLGECCVMAGASNLAGSAILGDHVIVGGAGNVNGHITIPSGFTVGPATTVISNPKDAKLLMGFYPAMEKRDFERSAVMIKALPDMRKQIKTLEAEVARLKAKLGEE